MDKFTDDLENDSTNNKSYHRHNAAIASHGIYTKSKDFLLSSAQSINSNNNCLRFLQAAPFPSENEDTIYKSIEDPYLNAELTNKNLWSKFSEQVNEMVVTKPGRRLFPSMCVKISGLEPLKDYCLLMDVVPVDRFRYRFRNGKWTICGTGEPMLLRSFYVHPSSPAPGKYWMNGKVSFGKAKLGKSVDMSYKQMLFVYSMHCYQPRIHIIKSSELNIIQTNAISTFSFVATKFITVTAYQNIEIIKLKVEHNPFAKGFRSSRKKIMKSDSSVQSEHQYKCICTNGEWANTEVCADCKRSFPFQQMIYKQSYANLSCNLQQKNEDPNYNFVRFPPDASNISSQSSSQEVTAMLPSCTRTFSSQTNLSRSDVIYHSVPSFPTPNRCDFFKPVSNVFISTTDIAVGASTSHCSRASLIQPYHPIIPQNNFRMSFQPGLSKICDDNLIVNMSEHENEKLLETNQGFNYPGF